MYTINGCQHHNLKPNLSKNKQQYNNKFIILTGSMLNKPNRWEFKFCASDKFFFGCSIIQLLNLNFTALCCCVSTTADERIRVFILNEVICHAHTNHYTNQRVLVFIVHTMLYLWHVHTITYFSIRSCMRVLF